MTPRQAMEVTMRHYLLLCKGERKKELERWRVARWQVWMMIQAMPLLKNRPRRPEDILHLGDERPPKAASNKITEAEKRELNRIFDDYRRKRGKN